MTHDAPSRISRDISGVLLPENEVLDSYTSRSPALSNICSIEIRARVAILYEADFPTSFTVDDKSFARDPETHNFCVVEADALRVVLNDDGSVIQLFTPLRLTKEDAARLGSIVKQVIQKATDAGRKLDGRDMISIITTLKTTLSQKVRHFSNASSHAEEIEVQFQMHAWHEHVTWSETNPLQIKEVKKGWHFVPFIGRLEGAETSCVVDYEEEDDRSDYILRRCPSCDFSINQRWG